MDLFNFISGVCSIIGLLVSLFTASKVIKISKTYNWANETNHSEVKNINKGNTFNGAFTGGNYINGTGSGEQK